MKDLCRRHGPVPTGVGEKEDLEFAAPVEATEAAVEATEAAFAAIDEVIASAGATSEPTVV